ncbi:MAG TPA: relaxase/mobilization nuclease RlxS [Rhizomicrobium sp.]
MNFDDEFEPRLGKIRSRSNKKVRTYLQRVLKGVALAGGRSIGGGRKRTFDGTRIGRGAGAGRVLASREPHAAFRSRRVIVKSRIVKLKGAGQKAAYLHLRYIQRDGVSREGEAGVLYDSANDRAEANGILDRVREDRHQFRIIVSPEDGEHYRDLKTVTRRFMAQMEEDLGTKLDWVAVDHFNTGHPHTHIVLRGADERGKDLIIAPEYLFHGMRERAAEILLRDLGPRTDQDIERSLRAEVEQERFTSLDRNLVAKADELGVVNTARIGTDTFSQSLGAGRLQKLARLGLDYEIAPGRWQLAENLEPVLREMGERGDIIKTLHREMAERRLQRDTGNFAIYDARDSQTPSLIGRLVGRGLGDDFHDAPYLIVDGLDGRTHYVTAGRGVDLDDIPDGAVIAVTPRHPGVRTVDRTVAEIAAAHGDHYSVDLHLQHDPSATAEFAETHVRRLEAMRRLGGHVEREPDGTWIIARDHIARASAFERKQAKLDPVTVETLSALPVEKQVTADGATWLDRELLKTRPTEIRDAGFGRDVANAMAQRRQWLVEQGFVREDGVSYRPDMLAMLQRRELARVAAQLSKELNLDYAPAKSGDKISGVYRRSLNLTSGRFAVIEKSREFMLVPWRPVLERSLGKQVSGIARGDTISWTIGRSRSGPAI